MVTVERRVARERTEEATAVPAAFMLHPQVGYIRLTTFANEKAADDLHAALGRLEGRDMKRLVLDLRDNGGGSVDEAARVAGEFLPKGAIVYTEQTRKKVEGEKDTVRVSRSFWSHEKRYPLVVLINAGTASASELVAGALQDHDRAVIVGRPSFGKALLMRGLPLADGSMIMLVVGHVTTPCGRVVQRQYRGITRRDSVRLARAERDSAGRPAGKTDGGRTVYGGGGIYPDVVLSEPDPAPLWLAREPQGRRVGLRQDDVRIDPATAVHRSPAVRLARRTTRRVALRARETDGVATRDAAVLPLDHSPARRGNVPDDQHDHRTVRQGKAAHQQRLAEARASHDDGPVVILQRAGHELRRARGAGVDQHDEGVPLLVAPERPAHAHRVLLTLDLLAGLLCVHDRALRQELARHSGRLVDAAAAVVAEVQHQSLHVAPFEAAQRRMQVVGSLLVRERREADVAHLRMQQERGGYRGRLLRPLPRHAALDRDHRAVQAATLQAELGSGAFRARQADVELLGALGLDGLRIDGDQLVARQDIQGRCLRARRYAHHHR